MCELDFGVRTVYIRGQVYDYALLTFLLIFKLILRIHGLI